MNERDDILRDLRSELMFDKPSLRAIEHHCEQFVELRKRERAITQPSLAPVTLPDEIDVTEEDDNYDGPGFADYDAPSAQELHETAYSERRALRGR